MKTFSVTVVLLVVVICSVGNTAPTNSATIQKNETQHKDGSDRIMYSYAEAVIDDNGTPTMQQLTIAKDKEGEYRFAKNQNGTFESGKWTGPLPSSPSLAEEQASKIINSIVTNDLVLDPLTIFNKNIGNTLQDYLFRAIMPIQFKK